MGNVTTGVVAPGSRSPGLSSTRVRLVEQARGGDRLAFERLIDGWIEPAFRTALAILGHEADARDATQDALLEAWRNIGRLRDPVRFDAWLGRIHVNACRTVGRRRRRVSVREIDMSGLPDPPQPMGGTLIDEDAVALDELERAFERLAISERSILVLHHLEHRSVASIAEALGIPEGTAKWRLHAARDALAQALEVERR
jgi:RNA polymerase sigma-70 factor (ECF subfamily)